MKDVDVTLAIQSLHEKVDRLGDHRGDSGGGGNGGSGHSDARLAAVEAKAASIENEVGRVRDELGVIRSDIKTQFLSGLVGIAFVLGVCGAGYARLDDKLDAVLEKIAAISVSVAKIEKP